nr:1998_t:CDS:2 [Entrophospora candida]
MVNAWGEDGHKIVGKIAQNILNPEIAKRVASLFQDPSFDGKLPLASLWADMIKEIPESPYNWSFPLHYMTTHDNPGRVCSVDEANDCAGGACIVGAIANYTDQLDCENGRDINTRDIALRFLSHFFGDITQPLHVCGRARGGNGIKVTFDGRPTNLHVIWDRDIVKKRLKDYNDNFETYANHLTNEITNGTFAKVSQTWISCKETKLKGLNLNLRKRAKATTKCPLTWAIDTNGINCPLVWAAIDDNPKVDLGGRYYQDAVQVIDQQLAKGGLRLGTFLNIILNKPCENN